MPRKQGSTDAQRTFLRTWIDHPEGPPADQWPDPVVFARWLRNRRFRATLNAIRDTHRYRSDLHLANASSVAAQSLDSESPDVTPQKPRMPRLLFWIDISVTSTGTITEWFAKGIGSIKSINQSHLEGSANGRRTSEDHLDTEVLRSYSIPSVL